MTIPFSARLGALPGYPLAEIPAIKRRLVGSGVDVIDLGAGDNDTPPPAVVVEALRAALGDPALSKYGFQQGLPAFRRATSDYMARRFGTRFDPATETLPLIGSKEGLAHLPYAVVNPGDVVLFPEPGYQAYIGGAILSGAEPRVHPLRAEEGFLLDLDRVPEAILRRTRLVYLNYPNNPTAAIAPMEYLERLFGPRVHKAMNTMQSELKKVRSGGKSELLDTLIVYRWHTLFEPFSRDPVEVGGPKTAVKR